MRISLLTITLTALALTACTTSKTKTESGEEAAMMKENAEAPESQPVEKPSAIQQVDAANKAFADAFERGDTERAAMHYDDEAVWFLSNGAPLRGRAGVQAMLTKAHADGAGRFTFDDLTVREVATVIYASEAFSFEVAPGKEVKGPRYSVWQTTPGHAPKITRDVWVPNTTAPDETHAEIDARLTEIATVYNGDDAARLQGVYTEDASMVLTSGKVIPTTGMNTMLADTAKMPIEDMRFGENARVYSAGAEHLYSIGDFDVTLPLPAGPLPLAGERVILWRRDGAEWKMAFEMSWPRNAPVAKL